MSRLLLFVCLLTLSACQNLEDGSTKVIVGATLLNRDGGQPVPDSVVVMTGGKIRVAGTRADTPIPQNSQRFNATGLFVLLARVPANREEWIRRNAASLSPPQEVIRTAGESGPGDSPDLVFFRRDPTVANANWASAERYLIAGTWQTAKP